ncbi:short transient receptor potential channel 4 [Cephus cinctus]|uniref:Short transient receptor potential channel 4 n=1 Tax=Cephus cinctus TaxID=211228 RepID=A0AAJ7BLB8_CEPCN|nr:short transient receptor potential channel 4 [Cephus cinctus]
MAKKLEEEEEEILNRRMGVMVSQLRELDKEFFEVVTIGNVADVRTFLASHGDVDLNVMNFEGISALHIAVKERNINMVEFLLSQPDVDVHDTALYAIRENEPRIAFMILKKLEEQSPGMEKVGATHSSEFADDATPLSVAAQYGHYEMITLLLDRGHKIVKPHPPSCFCAEVCKPQRESEDPLTLDRMRLELYRAIANPAYICQDSYDPILVAFELSRELRLAGLYEHEFYDAYKTLSEDVAQFATDLIGCARTADEVEVVLKQMAGLGFTTPFIYPRLLLAMDCRQKSFVAHPNVQQVIESKWMGDWYEWKIKSALWKALMIPPRMLILPIITMMLLVAPNSARSKRWKIPANRFLSSVASYIVFLGFVFFESNLSKTNQLRGPPNSGIEPVIVLYVISFIWGAICLCLIQGPHRFFRTPWNWYEVIMLSLFLLTFLFWAAAAIDVAKNGQRDLERKYWHKYDPTLVSEGLFCIATIMAFFKLMFICQLNYHLGPLQMSLGKMINDVAKFIVIFSIVMISFAAGLTRLYQYYDEMVQIDESKIKTQQVSSFVDFTSTLKTLFWAIFCMSAIESADVIIENLPGENDSETIINKHTYTEAIGYVAFAGFEFISVVVVLNMLIACMSNTFTKITDNVDVEWTFGRTEVYVDFMAQANLPPPFNLLSTARGILWIIEYFKILINKPPDKRARWNIKHCCYIENVDENDKENFSVVMTQLVQRYFRKKQAKAEQTDVEGLRREITELRGILRDLLSSS